MPTYRLAELAVDETSLSPEARELLHAEIARRPPSIAREPRSPEGPASERAPLDGVYGWLAWYCLGSFGAMYSQIRLGVSFVGGSSDVMLAFALFCFGRAAWDLATGIAIVRRSRSALWMILVQLTAGAFLGAVISVDGLALLISPPVAGVVGLAVIAWGILIVASYAIWFRYFQVSKRVNATFGRNL